MEYYRCDVLQPLWCLGPKGRPQREEPYFVSSPWTDIDMWEKVRMFYPENNINSTYEVETGPSLHNFAGFGLIFCLP